MANVLEAPVDDDRERGRRVFAVLLIVAGITMLLGRLDLPAPYHLRDVWPVLIIAFGAIRFWSHRTGRRRGAGLGTMVGGIVLLLHTQRLVSLDDSWPLFIVGVGISILVSAWSADGRPAEGGRP